jgi:TRAP-type uncharacterized transport system substrate-binding protein
VFQSMSVWFSRASVVVSASIALPCVLSAQTVQSQPTLVRAPVEVSKPSGTLPPVAVVPAASKSSEAVRSASPRLSESKFKESINRWTIGLAAGRVEGAPLRLAAELAQVLDDGDNLRVMPIVTRGPFDNFNDLLHLRGVDLGIVYGDTLDHFKNKEKISNVDNRVVFIANLFPAEVHVLARPEITTLKDLEGKIVNFNTQGTAAAFTGPIIFERLGIKIQATFTPHRAALEKMKAGPEVAATFWVTSKPIAPLATPPWPAGFKLLAVEYVKSLEEYYLPASLDHADYPKLIPQGQKVATIAVPTVLAAYNWAPDTDRARRISRMVDRLFERWGELHKDPNDPKWKDVNLASTVPGWKRYPYMQEKLNQISGKPAGSPAPAATSSIDPAIARAQVQRAAPNSRAEQERLFQQFMQWSKQRSAQ